MRFLLFMLLMLSSASFAQETAEKKVKDLKLQISESENINLKYSEQFKFKVTKDPDDGFEPALSFSSFKNQFKSLGMKIFLSKDPNKTLKTKDDALKILEKASSRYISGSVEKKLNVKEVKIPDSVCIYSSFTDSSIQNVEKPLPGQFKHITLGYLVKGEFIVYFKAFSNSVSDEEFQSALNIIKSVSFTKIEQKGK